MKDVNTYLQKAWYEALQATGDYYVEDEEPDDLNNDLYGIIQSVSTTDASDQTCTKVNCTIQISLHSRNIKYNNRVALNAMAGRLFAAVKPQSNSILDMEPYNIQMTNLRLLQDTQQDFGKLGAYDYKTRVLIFTQGLFIR